MPYLLVRHGVRDDARWRASFDAGAEGRNAASMHVLRDLLDPHIAVFLFEIEDRARAEDHMGRPGGGKIAEEAGVQPPFDVQWLEK